MATRASSLPLLALLLACGCVPAVPLPPPPPVAPPTDPPLDEAPIEEPLPEPVEPAPDRIGEVKPGMSREAVEALVGEPDEIVGFPNLTYHALYGSWTIAYSKEHTVIEAYDRDAPFEELGDPPAGGK